jgi:hypothetical protein
MKDSSDDRVAHLTEELERVRRELAQLQQATGHIRPPGLLRSGRLMAAAPVLLLGTWLLSAGAPAQDDLEKRVSDLEERLLKGPGTTTRIKAPFEVVGAGGNVILQVSQAFPTVSNGVGIFWQGKDGGVTVSRSGHDIAGMGSSESGEGGLLFIGDQYGVPRAEVRAADGVSVLNAGGKVVASMVTIEGDEGRFAVMRGDKIVAAMEGGDDGGLLDIADDMGKSLAQIGIEDDNGYIATMDPKGRADVEMGVSDKGEPQLTVNQKGKPRATLGLRIGAGHLSLANAKDRIVANVTGTGSGDGGAVIIGNGSGKGVASLEAGADGSGLVQVFQPGAGSVVVMAQDKAGGLLQIKSGAGTPVANVKTGPGGAGYLQLTDPTGNPAVEAGFDDQGSGVVRAGPYYRCSATAQAVPLIGVARLPDCIRGRNKP